MNKKIAILGLHSDYNLGDPLICQTVIKLLDEFYNGDITINKIDLRYYHSQLIELFKNSFLRYIFLLLHWSLKLASKSNISIIDNLWINYLSYEMERLLINADSAIIAGGGLYIINIITIIRVFVPSFSPVNEGKYQFLLMQLE